MQELKSKHKEAALGEWSDLAESCQNRGPSPANAKPARKKKKPARLVCRLQAGVRFLGTGFALGNAPISAAENMWTG